MKSSINVISEQDKDKIKLEGREVCWLMTPKDTGSQYSSACTVQVYPGKRAKPAHAHKNGEEIVYIVSGKGKVLVGDQISEIHPGSIILFPQGVPHMLYNNGSEMLKGICFYAPAENATEYEYYEDVDFPEFK